jgi:hypothetical protein
MHARHHRRFLVPRRPEMGAHDVQARKLRTTASRHAGCIQRELTRRPGVIRMRIRMPVCASKVLSIRPYTGK